MAYMLHHQVGQPACRIPVRSGVGEIHPHGPVKIIGVVSVFLVPVPFLVVVEGIGGNVCGLSSRLGIKQVDEGFLARPQLQPQLLLSPLAHNINPPWLACSIINHRTVQSKAGPIQSPGYLIRPAQNGDDLVGGEFFGKPSLRVAVISCHSLRTGAVRVVISRYIEKTVGLTLSGVLHHQGVLRLLLDLMGGRRGSRHPHGWIWLGQSSALP